MHLALRAFRHRNFRLFYAGQAISLIGTWIQQIALSWLVYRTTGSGFLLGLVTFCSQIPMLIFLPLAGLLSDRYDQRRLMMLAYLLAAIQALTLGALTLSGAIRVWQILVLGFAYGVIMAFETPARQALISLTASPYTVLMPMFARDVFGGDARTLGFLVGSAGLGAVIGTAFLTTRPDVFGLSRLVPFTAAAAGIALMRTLPAVRADLRKAPDRFAVNS